MTTLIIPPPPPPHFSFYLSFLLVCENFDTAMLNKYYFDSSSSRVCSQGTIFTNYSSEVTHSPLYSIIKV